jgi:tetratricopeptide (TPR) repeat protein
MIETGRIPLTGKALAWFRQGLADAALGKPEKAVALYNQVIDARPDFWEAWYERGLVLQDLGLYGESIASLAHALQLEPPLQVYGEIWYHRARAFQYGLGDYSAALQDYDRVLQHHANHSLAWYERGNVLLYGLVKAKAALESYEQALHHQPAMAVAWRNRGHALVALAHHAVAVESYDRALALVPDDVAAQQGRQMAIAAASLSDQPQNTTKVASASGDVSAGPVSADAAAGFDITFMDAVLEEGRSGQRLADYVPVEATSALTLDPSSLLLQPIVSIEDEAGSRDIYLFQRQYRIGRDSRNDICLKSRFASRFHAVLHRIDRPDGQYSYQIQDGDTSGKPSTNGIRINGQVTRQATLQSGDTIVFGPKTQMQYHMPDQG